MNNYGIWNVTTEGDCEGRTMKNLGVWEGYVDEIAFELADKCFYKLYFKPTQINKPNQIKRKDVCISIDGLCSLDTKREEEIRIVKNFFHDRNVFVDYGNFGLKISTEEKTVEEKKEEILNKLTKQEREILGF